MNITKLTIIIFTFIICLSCVDASAQNEHFGYPVISGQHIKLDKINLRKPTFKEGRPLVITDIYTLGYIEQAHVTPSRAFTYKHVEQNIFAQVNNTLIKTNIANIVMANSEEHPYNTYSSVDDRNLHLKQFVADNNIASDRLYALVVDIEDIEIDGVNTQGKYYIYLIDLNTMMIVNRYDNPIHEHITEKTDGIEAVKELIYDIADHCKYVIKDELKKKKK